MAGSVLYQSKPDTSNEDDTFESSTYDLELDGRGKTTVAFGKVCHDHSSAGIVYFPMYLVVGETVQNQFGVIEFPLTKLPSIYDEDDDIDPKYITDPIVFEDDEKEEKESVEEEPEPEDDVFEVVALANEEPKKPKKVGLFEKSRGNLRFPPAPPFPYQELTEEEDDSPPAYEENPKNDWITKFMKNADYRLTHETYGSLPNPFSQERGVAGGRQPPALFHVICDAFSQIGEITTPQKLRDFLAEEATPSQYEEYRDAFLDIKNVVDTKRKVLAGYVDGGKILKQRIKGIS